MELLKKWENDILVGFNNIVLQVMAAVFKIMFGFFLWNYLLHGIFNVSGFQFYINVPLHGFGQEITENVT